MKDDIIKKSYIASFDIDDKALKDLIIINTKSLIDDNTQRFVYMDNNRLKDELIYYRYYSEIPQYNSVMSIFLPIVLSNTNLQKSEDEIINLIPKYVKYLKKEDKLFEYLLSGVLYNCMIHNLIENRDIEYTDLLQAMKERMITFNVELDKISTIKFQMIRINAIQQIDKYIDLKIQEHDTNDNVILGILNSLYDIYIEDRVVENDGIKSIKKSILSILGDEGNLNIDNIDFISQMSEYIIKLRKYIINKKIYNQKSDPRNLIGLKENDTTTDPILNQITVLSKTFSNNILLIKVKSKSGIYTLKFKKS